MGDFKYVNKKCGKEYLCTSKPLNTEAALYNTAQLPNVCHIYTVQ